MHQTSPPPSELTCVEQADENAAPDARAPQVRARRHTPHPPSAPSRVFAHVGVSGRTEPTAITVWSSGLTAGEGGEMSARRIVVSLVESVGPWPSRPEHRVPEREHDVCRDAADA